MTAEEYKKICLLLDNIERELNHARLVIAKLYVDEEDSKQESGENDDKQ